MRVSYRFWYYFLLAVLFFSFLVFGNFGPTSFSHRVLIGILVLVLLFNPFLILWGRERRHIHVLPTAPEVRAKVEAQATVNHQLRTPLAAIKWTLSELLAGTLGPINQEQKEFVERGFKSADRVIKIINKEDEYHLASTDLGALVRDLTFEFTDRAKNKNLTLEVTPVPSHLPLLQIDTVKLGIAIENLLDNACKYTPAGGKVTVSIHDDKLQASPPQVELVIADTGMGIPAGEQGRIFERFYRASNAVQALADGTGVGLALVKEIIERHGGTIRFTSTEGQGTSFHILLPVR